MDHIDQKPSLFKEEEEEENKVERGYREDESNEEARIKSCTACKTTKTPLWRSGPAGPKSLCNACGIRYRKKRGGPQVGPDGINEREGAHYNSGSMSVRFVVMGKKVILQRPRPKPKPKPSPSPTSCLSSSSDIPRVKKQRCQRRRKIRMKEEEMAAFSLMALSCGSVFA